MKRCKYLVVYCVELGGVKDVLIQLAQATTR